MELPKELADPVKEMIGELVGAGAEAPDRLANPVPVGSTTGFEEAGTAAALLLGVGAIVMVER